jgi:hypothetical protein
MLGKTYTLGQIADVLQIKGKDRERAARRRLEKHGVPFIKGPPAIVTEAQLGLLLERMTCSPSEGAVDTTIAVERSESRKRRGSSKSTLRDAVGMRLQTNTEPASNMKCSKNSFTVVQGGLSKKRSRMRATST